MHLGGNFLNLLIEKLVIFLKIRKFWCIDFNCVGYEEPKLTMVIDAQWSLFSLKSRTFGLEQTNWADKFWDIWSIFSQTISTNVSMFSINQPLFLQKLSFYIQIPNIYLGLGFEFGPRIWAAKNRVSVVHGIMQIDLLSNGKAFIGVKIINDLSNM